MTDFATLAASLIPRLAQDLGVSPAQAAGIIGQLGYESAGLQAINERNPVVPGSRGGFGWAQWTGPRRVAFEQWARAKGMPVGSPEANYGFLLHELKNTPEGQVLGDIRRSPDAISAGRVFTNEFLRPGIVNQSSRDEWTRRALAAQGITPANNSSPSAAMQTATDNPAQAVMPASFAPPSPDPAGPSIFDALAPIIENVGNAAAPQEQPPQDPLVADLLADLARAQLQEPPPKAPPRPLMPNDPLARGMQPRYIL